jgi:hypothetical protein
MHTFSHGIIGLVLSSDEYLIVLHVVFVSIEAIYIAEWLSSERLNIDKSCKKSLE